MNADDPKLTAFALGELDPAERAELEQMLRDDAAADAEVQSAREFAAMLRARLQSEPAADLGAARRIELLEIAASARPRRVIVLSQRTVVWSAIAASVVIGASLALLLPALSQLQSRPAAVESHVVNPRINDGSQVRVALVPDAKIESMPSVVAPHSELSAAGWESSAMANSPFIAPHFEVDRFPFESWHFSLSETGFPSNAGETSSSIGLSFSGAEIPLEKPAVAAPIKAPRTRR